MFRLKIVRYTVFLGSTISLLLPFFSEYVRQKTLQRYDLRWHQELDTRSRIQTIAVRNAGSQPKGNLVLDIDLGPNKSGVISDFEASLSDRKPYTSFMEAVTKGSFALETLVLKSPERDRIIQAVDRHSSSRNLDDLDKIFDDILEERLAALAGSKILNYFHQTNTPPANWHDIWHQKCGVTKPSSDCSKVDAILADWERSKQGFLNQALFKWHEATDLRLEPESEGLSPNGRVSVTLSLAAGEARFLRFHYSHNPASALTVLRSTTGEQTVQVRKPSDLFSTPVSILFDLHPNLKIFLGLIFLILVLLSPFLVPVQLLPIHRVFNIALETEDYEFWQQALDRYRFFILQQFRELRRIFNPELVADPEEIMDFVRNGLTIVHKSNGLGFRNIRDLNAFIHDELRDLVLNAK